MVAREAMPRTAPMARRRDGDIAPYRNGTWQRGGARGYGNGSGGKVVWHGGAHHAGVMAVGRDVPIAPPE